jgi:acyl-CoA thioester hydrolase
MTTHSIEIRVRYCECDPMGVAHHSVYPVWFEMGRTEMLRAAGGDYREIESQGVFLAVVKLEVTYRRPARYDDVLTLVTTLVSARHVKIRHSYELLRDGESIAIAATTLACLDGSGRPRALPEQLCTSRD